MWFHLFVVPFACGGFCLSCLLRAWRACVHVVHVCMALRSLCMASHEYKVAPTLENGTAIFWRSCANLFWFFFLCCIQLSTTSRKCTPLSYSLLHLFRITSAVVRRCFVASALLRRSFGVAWALLRRSFGVRRCFGGVRCIFGATSVQLWLNLGSTMRSAQPKPHGRLLRCSFV